MAEKQEKPQDKNQPTQGLYPDSKKKLITPINVTQSGEENADIPQQAKAPLKSPAEKKALSPIKKSAKPMISQETESSTDLKTKQTKPKETQNGASISEDEDSQANTVEAEKSEPDTPEFVDEGQYHISVPKGSARKHQKSSPAKKFLMFILLAMLLAISAYLYMYFSGIEIDYQSAYDNFINLIGIK